jgi:hypothetical protein
MRGDDDQEQLRAGTGYPQAQMARAFVTTLSHEGAATRRRA